MSREEFLRAVHDDVDPMKFAGEGQFSVDEYFPQDINNPYIQGDIPGAGEGYYPPPRNPPKRRR